MEGMEAISNQWEHKRRHRRKRFWGALASGLLFLGLIIGVFGLTGKAYALPLTGMGNFTVSFNKLVGTGYTFYPKLGETGTSSAAPLGRNKIDHLTVYGLKITKDFKLPTGQKLELQISSSKPVVIQGLVQDSSLLKGDASFSHLTLQEHNNPDWTKQFTQSSSQITLKNASLVTDYLYQNEITLNGMTLSIHKVKK